MGQSIPDGKRKKFGAFFLSCKMFPVHAEKRKIFPKKIREGPVTFFRKNGAVTITRKFRPLILESIQILFTAKSRRLDTFSFYFSRHPSCP